MKEKENEESSHGSIYDLGPNKIGFYAEINQETASKLIELVLTKARELKKGRKLYIFVRSHGGCVYSTLAVYDHLVKLGKRREIIMVAEGHVASCGTVLWCAGTQRLAMRNASFLFHQITTQFSGKCTDLRYEQLQCDMLMKKMINIYSKTSEMSIANIKKLLSKELVLTARAAEKRGFVEGWYD